MANTWKGSNAPSLPSDFDQQKSEGPAPALHYQVRRAANGLEFSATSAQGIKSVLPVEAVIGGKRHGVSFLLRLNQVDGIPLARPTLALQKQGDQTPAQQVLALAAKLDPEIAARLPGQAK